MGFFRNTKQIRKPEQGITEETAEPETTVAGTTTPAGGEADVDVSGGLDMQPIDHNKGITPIFCPI